MNAAMLMVCLAGAGAIGQPEETIFKARRIEVKTATSDGKTFSYLLYNRVYLGRQFHKSTSQPDLERLPTTYFHDKSPIGVILGDAKAFPAKGAPPVMVLGMDIGTLAAYAKPGQDFHFTERVPTFVKLSLPDKGEKRYFTFVQDAIDRGAKVKIFEGEPRAMLEKHGKDKFYKVIVVETYKLPVVEVHKELMTKEALQLLMSKLTDDGIVAFHTSNRYYQLAPIIASAANELKLACIVGRDDQDRADRTDDFRFSSEWVMVGRDRKQVARLKSEEGSYVHWLEPAVLNGAFGKPFPTKIKTQFLWTDKGGQPFRGLYYSDPEIDNLQDVVTDVQNFFVDSFGIPTQRTIEVGRPIRGFLRAWSKSSADQLNRGSPLEPKLKSEKK